MSELLIPLHIERLPEGVFLATSASLPGLVAKGRTLEETVEIARDVAKKLIESLKERGDPLPSSLQSSPDQCDLLAPVGV